MAYLNGNDFLHAEYSISENNVLCCQTFFFHRSVPLYITWFRFDIRDIFTYIFSIKYQDGMEKIVEP